MTNGVVCCLLFWVCVCCLLLDVVCYVLLGVVRCCFGVACWSRGLSVSLFVVRHDCASLVVVCLCCSLVTLCVLFVVCNAVFVGGWCCSLMHVRCFWAVFS